MHDKFPENGMITDKIHWVYEYALENEKRLADLEMRVAQGPPLGATRPVATVASEGTASPSESYPDFLPKSPQTRATHKKYLRVLEIMPTRLQLLEWLNVLEFKKKYSKEAGAREWKCTVSTSQARFFYLKHLGKVEFIKTEWAYRRIDDQSCSTEIRKERDTV